MDAPAHIIKIAENVVNNLLPEKSTSRYWKEYEVFLKWCTENKIETYNEYVLLAYFEERSKKAQSSTLWSAHSMLRTTLNIKHNVNIATYSKLIAFLKRKKDGYIPKKSKTLEIEEIESFLSGAPNEDYLMIKAALIIGMCAACRRQELVNMTVDDVQDKGDVMIIKIPDTKTKKPLTSCITKAPWINIIREYKSLRPPGIELSRFFLFYAKNKCTRQPVGIHTLGSMPAKIAAFLKLENPKQYTGHCFRRSSATILAGHGADITTVKRHGGWKSTTVAENYIEDSLKAKIAIANQLVGQNCCNSKPSTSYSDIHGVQSSSEEIQHADSPSMSSNNLQNFQLKLRDANLPSINISNCENCTINFNFK